MIISTGSLRNHPLLLLHKEIASLCQPLFRKLELSILNFIRLYDDKKVIYLSDNHDWLQYYFVHQYPNIGYFEQNFTDRTQQYVLWDVLADHDPIVIYSRQMFNIKYGITLVRPFAGGCDFFNFGTGKNERAVLNQLINHLPNFDYFVQLFYEKAKGLMQTAHKHIISLENFSEVSAAKNARPRFYLGPEYDYQYLTLKEIACLKDLIKGLTVPEIAQLRDVSFRTIEKHIERIKNKLNCQTQFELGYLASQLEIDKL